MKVIDADVAERRKAGADDAPWIERCDRQILTWSGRETARPVTSIHDAISEERLAEIVRNEPAIPADREGLSGMPVTWSVVSLDERVEAPMLQRAPDLFGNRMEVLGPHGRTIASVVWTPRFMVRRHRIYSGRDRAKRLTVRGRFGRHWRLAVTDGDEHTIGTIARLRPSGKRISRRRRKIPQGSFDDLDRLEINVKRGRLTPALRWGLIAWAVLVARTGDDKHAPLSRLFGR